MFSLFRKKPKVEDEALNELALMLTFDEDNPTYRRELLNNSDFDFSLESLKKLDEYLAILHKSPPSGNDAARVILRAGAYTGEVFCRNCPTDFHWLRYEEACKFVTNLAEWPNSLGTCYVLFKAPDCLIFPMGKVAKFLENGDEDNTHAFVTALIDIESKQLIMP